MTMSASHLLRPLGWAALLVVSLGLQIEAQTRTATPRQPPPSPVASAPVRATVKCDEAAAHPEDKGRKATGVADEDLVPYLGVEACAAAIKQLPALGRLHFQLGRALWAAEEYDDAVLAFLAAQERGYAPAYYYLALVFEEGRGGEKSDDKAAADLYLLGALADFPPAMRAYDGSGEPSSDEEWQAFENPRVMKALLTGNLLDLFEIDRLYLLAYLRGVEDFLTENPNEHEPSCAAAMTPQMETDLQRAIQRQIAIVQNGGLLQQMEVANRDLEAPRQDGTDDIYALAIDYGGCKGPTVKKFLANLKTYLADLPK